MPGVNMRVWDYCWCYVKERDEDGWYVLEDSTVKMTGVCFLTALWRWLVCVCGQYYEDDRCDILFESKSPFLHYGKIERYVQDTCTLLYMPGPKEATLSTKFVLWWEKNEQCTHWLYWKSKRAGHLKSGNILSERSHTDYLLWLCILHRNTQKRLKKKKQ